MFRLRELERKDLPIINRWSKNDHKKRGMVDNTTKSGGYLN